jgi:hypothetical protein
MSGISLCAQRDSSSDIRVKNSFFLELAGNGVEHGVGLEWPSEDFSLNYDRIVLLSKKSKTTLRIGSNFPFTKNMHIIPIMLNVLFGKKNFFFEVGGGFELLILDANYLHPHSAITCVLGCRYQNIKRGIMARAGVTPTVGILPGEIYLGPIAGLSFGYSF